ncbi:hypothetical protein HJC23_002546 [Cyclotella cryptica]|uniref:2Fe-2S ferredoxin-type domain-containing protein n=1 Tax=Cyclotella cryptica TaxID=29204 RepID=A0ABD3QW19_9STRA|eukprot:CCRYP_001395-RA/>CCRYP_001395-RA protein AED:0.41 eAED:0.41 QI:0/-1/0/1/-1/1/1/0/380
MERTEICNARKRSCFAATISTFVCFALFLNLITNAAAFAAHHLVTIHQLKQNVIQTRLCEQRANVKELLGPVSPATMQSYNLPPSILSSGWSAQIVTRTAKSLEETTDVQLIPRNEKDHFVDTVTVEIPLYSSGDVDRRQEGLGIELLEIEGGREDGLGIVIVKGLVPGGNADNACKYDNTPSQIERIMYGDSIVKADLILRRRGSGTNEEQTDVRSIQTECLGYDSMVNQLVGLLTPLNDHAMINSATVILTLKRLRRRPRIDVQLYYPPAQNLPPATITLQPGDNLRMAMLQRGIKLNDPLAQRYDGKPTGSGNCGSGGLCRTCAVSVLRGGELLSPQKLNEKKMLEDTPRWRLACKSWVGYGMKEGDVVIQVNPRQW